MIPKTFPEQNRILFKPKDMVDPCGILPVHVDGKYIHSLWSLSWRERLRVLFTGRLWVTVYGEGHPPIALSTEKQF